MKLIFECETELGQCDSDRIEGHFEDESGDWIAFVLTTAATTGAKGMLRIEQCCYLRSKECLDNIRNQNWVKPEMTLEPLLDSKEETVQTVQKLHDAFVEKARKEFVDQSILAGADPFVPAAMEPDPAAESPARNSTRQVRA